MTVRQELHSYIESALDLELHELEPREPRLRVSGLPYCGLRHLWVLHNPPIAAGAPVPLSFNKEYYTSVGTTVHTALQRWVGTGSRLYGNWRCRKPECDNLVKFSAYTDCKKCGSGTLYEEFTVRAFKHLSGHTDGLYKSKANRWWVIDYKTTSLKVLDRHGTDPVLPYASNKFQITSYVPMIEELLGIKVSGWALIYLARDNPRKFRVVSDTMTDGAKRARMLKLKLFDDQYDLVTTRITGLTVKNAEWLIETKFCQNYDHYTRSMKGYNPCPLEAVCFTKNLKALVLDGVPVSIKRHSGSKNVAI